MVFFEKHLPEPQALFEERAKVAGNYRREEILEQIRSDFMNKCYLCEGKPGTINVEHFVPHRGDKNLEFAWENLFFCCGHCNNTKGDFAEYDDILNCTVADDAVDTKIKYTIVPLPREQARFQALEDSGRVLNTVSLLDDAFNGTTPLKILESANLRSELLKDIRGFNDLLFAYNDAEFDPVERNRIRNLIAVQLRHSSLFTAFKKWIVRESVFAVEFADLM